MPALGRKQRVGAGRLSSLQEAYRAFHQPLIDELRECYQFTKVRVAPPKNGVDFPVGPNVGHYSIAFKQGGDRMSVELYLDRKTARATKALFDALLDQREAIEQRFGASLKWERLDNRRASRIVLYLPGSIDSSAQDLKILRAAGIYYLLRLKKAVEPALRKVLA